MGIGVNIGLRRLFDCRQLVWKGAKVKRQLKKFLVEGEGVKVETNNEKAETIVCLIVEGKSLVLFKVGSNSPVPDSLIQLLKNVYETGRMQGKYEMEPHPNDDPAKIIDSIETVYEGNLL